MPSCIQLPTLDVCNTRIIKEKEKKRRKEKERTVWKSFNLNGEPIRLAIV
jgi:hypothetical protein